MPTVGDIGAFIAGGAADSSTSGLVVVPQAEPFGGSDDVMPISVASPGGTPTVSNRRTRQLTAILVADNRPVAVIDDEVVSVGDVLRDGARVARIQTERVFLVEKNGKWRTLTLTQP